MLAKLCASMASFSDPGFEIGPRRAGSRLFAKTSAFGIYLHRVEPKEARTTPAARSPATNRQAGLASVGRLDSRTTGLPVPFSANVNQCKFAIAERLQTCTSANLRYLSSCKTEFVQTCTR